MFIGRWAYIGTDGMYNPYSGVINNQLEGLNHVFKSLHAWHEVSVDCLMLSFYYLQGNYLSKISCGQNGLGIYHVHSRFNKCLLLLYPFRKQKFTNQKKLFPELKAN